MNEINHEFADKRIIKAKLTGVNNKPDCVDLTIKHNLQRVEVSLTAADILALAEQLNLEVK